VASEEESLRHAGSIAQYRCDLISGQHLHDLAGELKICLAIPTIKAESLS